jgi:hypothetical protein
VARDRLQRATVLLAFQELARPHRSPRVRREAANFVVALLLSEGRWRDAQRELARYRAELPDDPDLPLWPAAAPLLGFPSTGGQRAFPPLEPARVPFAPFASGWPARYTAGRRALAAGDTAAALEAFLAQDLLASVGDAAARGPVWLAHGRVLAARGRRDGAVRYLRRAAELLTYADPPLDAVRDSALATLRALGVEP